MPQLMELQLGFTPGPAHQPKQAASGRVVAQPRFQLRLWQERQQLDLTPREGIQHHPRPPGAPGILRLEGALGAQHGRKAQGHRTFSARRRRFCSSQCIAST